MPDCLYVYAIVSAPCTLPSKLTGLDCEPVSLVVAGELAAAVSGSASSEQRPTAERLLMHESVVEAIRAHAQALPVRFGTLLPGRDAVIRALNERRAHLAAELSRLGRLAEFGLVVLWHNMALQNEERAGGGAAGSVEIHPDDHLREGTRYIMARMAEHRWAEGLRERAGTLVGTLEATLGALAIESRHDACPTTQLALRAAYLVEPERSADFRRAFDEIHGELANVRCLLSGPWPPYSFVRPASGADDVRRNDPVLSLAHRMARFL